VFDFDTPISRAGTNAEKYTALKRLFGRDDVLPFWVADMEFTVAPAIREALAARMEHPVYGYTSIPESLVEAITAWNENRYDLTLVHNSVTLVPGVMSGVSAAIFGLSEPGDSIVIQPPLYPPLMHTVRKNGRQLVENQLVIQDGRYQIDFNDLERLFQTHQPKILLLCSPHNPVGRVWQRDELARLVELVKQYNVYLVSDEIHADIVFPPYTHVSALSVDEEMSGRIVVLNSASKSFNIAGLNTAYALIPDLKLRTSFRQQLRRMNLHGINLFGMTALEAAYNQGEGWLDALLAYLQSNRQFMTETLNSELPGLQHFVPEGTYLYWLNFNSLDLTAQQIKEMLINDARVGLNDGITFSRAAEGFWRFNFAVPRLMLEQGLERIVRAFE
jgi:cystathionine beta-lyase